ncbi:MAG: FAD-dependent oxidoreductase [Actinomycetales bacterium]|nr:FAD-dependent oxidoreductase [Actinomycetales bacterium]
MAETPSTEPDATTSAPARRRRTAASPAAVPTAVAPTAAGQSPEAAAAPGFVDRGGAWCVVGAGPHGLSALKALLQNGIEADGFERESDVGGNWNFGAENSRVYESTHLISSKPFTQFPDFPMPDSYPDYPSHRQVKEYFGRYADHFGLRDRIRFSHDVIRAAPVDDGHAWDVTSLDLVTGAETTYRYAGLVVANGHNWSPKIPAYPGLETFRGEVLHSADYKGADVLRGKRVLVVGAGNTGCDVAVESAQHAAHTWHSTRRGYYYNPKYALGRPSDQVADRLLALRIPLGIRRALFGATLKATVGDLTRYGLKRPDHKFFETHPIVNQQLVYYVGHGDITPVDDVDHVDETGVVLTDGTRVDVDLLVLCTGYLVRFPFLEPEWLNWRDDHPHLFLQMFTPSYDNLVVSGLIQPDSGQWTLAHWQGVLVARVAEALRVRPAQARALLARSAAEADRRYSAGADYKDSTRHYYEVAHQDYLRALQDAIRALEVSP